jgi:hypothetical protein
LQIIYLIGGGRSGESALLLRVTSGRASRQPRRATDFGRLVECLLQSRGQHFLSADGARGPFSRAIRALDEPDDEHDGHERARRERKPREHVPHFASKTVRKSPPLHQLECILLGRENRAHSIQFMAARRRLGPKHKPMLGQRPTGGISRGAWIFKCRGQK